MNATLPQPYAPGSLRLRSATHVRAEGRDLLFFGGSNYLGLTWHPNLRRAIARAARTPPTHTNGSRATTGEHADYRALEREAAAFFGGADAALVPSGYVAPIAAMQALRHECTHVLLDAASHLCVADAARLSRRPIIRFARSSPTDLRRRLGRLPPDARPLVATDGAFGLRGGFSPLDDYLDALPRDGWLLVDDAHGGGCVGPGGRGTVALLKLRDPRVVQTFSLSKALGAGGGVIVGPTLVTDAVRTAAPAFVGTTAPPLVVIAAARAALRMLKLGRAPVRQFQANARLLHASLPARPEISGDPRTPATAVYPSSAPQAAALRRALLAVGILPSWTRYPTGPAAGFFRFAVSGAHAPAQVRRLAAAIRAGLADSA